MYAATRGRQQLRHGRDFTARLQPARDERRPVCPRCGGLMVKMFIECDDKSGWVVGFTCPCYDNDTPEAAHAARA